MKIPLFVLAAVLVLCAGLWLFLPWETLWDKALHTGLAHVPGASVSWERVADASPLRFTLKNLDVTIKNTRLHVPEARVGLGLSPLITAHLDTAGPDTAGDDAARTSLHLRLFRGKTLTLDGRVDLAVLLPDVKIAGLPEVHADFKWEKWKGYPVGGSLELGAREVTLSDNIQAQGLKILAVLAKDVITIRNFEISSPVPLRVRGAARLDRKNFFNTTYEVKGGLFPKGANLPFQHSGRLGGLF